jgi:hypothetical protein
MGSFGSGGRYSDPDRNRDSGLDGDANRDARRSDRDGNGHAHEYGDSVFDRHGDTDTLGDGQRHAHADCDDHVDVDADCVHDTHADADRHGYSNHREPDGHADHGSGVCRRTRRLPHADDQRQGVPGAHRQIA